MLPLGRHAVTELLDPGVVPVLIFRGPSVLVSEGATLIGSHPSHAGGFSALRVLASIPGYPLSVQGEPFHRCNVMPPRVMIVISLMMSDVEQDPFMLFGKMSLGASSHFFF